MNELEEKMWRKKVIITAIYNWNGKGKDSLEEAWTEKKKRLDLKPLCVFQFLSLILFLCEYRQHVYGQLGLRSTWFTTWLAATLHV